jgi:hypothetical protein
MFLSIRLVAASTLILAGTVSWVRPAPAQPTLYYAFCWTPPTKQLVYVSAPFQSSEGSTAKLEAAFKAFVKQQYGYSANDGQCSTDLTAAARDGKRAAVLKQAQGLDGEVTAVTFSYTPPAVAASAPAAVPAAAPSPADTSLDPGNLKDPWLQKAKDELKGSKGWCSTNILLHRIFDCDCFARLVFQFRVAHAGQYKQSNREEGTGWVGLTNVLMAQDFVCTHCLEEARLTKYVHDTMMENNTPAISAGRTTAARVNARADCVAPKYIAEFKAHPHVFEEQGNYNRALSGCGAP